MLWNLTYLAASVVVLGGGAFLAFQNREPERDPKSLCAVGQESGHTLILIDKTDLWNEAEADRLEEHIWDIVSNKVKAEERLSVFVFSDRIVRGFPPAFSFCKPRTGQDVNDITRSKAYFNRQYKKQFVDPLSALLENVKRPEEAGCSPIMEVLFDVLMRSEIRSHVGPTRVVLVSDLAQNSPLYSFYMSRKCRPNGKGNDPRRDTSVIEAFIKERGDVLKDKNISFLVYQVIPEKSSKQLTSEVKEKWMAFFGFFNVSVDWQLL